MPSSTSHQKFSFSHLPTRGRAGIKLGDAWYVSNVSIIFDCSMLYYLLFWTILGFIFHFYNFWDQPINRRPSPELLFFAYFNVSEKRNIKRSPNGMKPSETWFSHQIRSRRLGPSVKKATRRSWGWRARPSPLGAPPTLWAPRSSTDILLPPIYTYVSPYDQNRSKKI